MTKLKKNVLVGSLALSTGVVSVIALTSAKTLASLPSMADLRSTISTPATGQSLQQKSAVSLEALIDEAAHKYKIDARILKAIAHRESGGKRDAIRFEPGQMQRAAKYTSNESTRRMLASSHGWFQIMGWWAPEFNLSWVDLYDPKTNVDVGARILRKGIDRNQHLPKAKRLFRALAEYNGSEAYAREVLQVIAEDVIQESLIL